MIQQLKEQIFFKVGKEILNRGDCEYLSRLIEIETGDYINYNTLRRFFEIEKQHCKPRTSTLDILCKYIGYLSFDHFSSFNPQIMYFNLNLRTFDILGEFNPDTVSSYFNDLNKNFNLRLNYIIQVCRYGLLSKHIKQLCSALRQMNFEQYSFSYDEIFVIGNSIGILFRKITLSKKEWKILYSDFFFNKYVFEVFVDYSSLNSYYLEYLKFKATSKQQLAFKNSLLVLRDYLNNKDLKAEELLIDMSEISDFHPILKGRILSIHLYHNEASEIPLDSIENIQLDHLYEPMVASILSSNFILYDFIQTKMSYFITDTKFRSIHYFQVYFLLKALKFYKSKHYNIAAQSLKEINMNDFRFSYKGMLSFFYYLIDYKIHTNLNSKEKAIQLSTALNYPKFNMDYIERF